MPVIVNSVMYGCNIHSVKAVEFECYNNTTFGLHGLKELNYITQTKNTGLDTAGAGRILQWYERKSTTPVCAFPITNAQADAKNGHTTDE